MLVPVAVPISGKLVPISYVDSIPGDTPEEHDSYGETGAGKQGGVEIRISKVKHHSERQVFETLVHEYYHAALKITGLHNLLDEKLEEAIVEGIEQAVAPLLCFNPDAKGVKWKDVEFPFEVD